MTGHMYEKGAIDRFVQIQHEVEHEQLAAPLASGKSATEQPNVSNSNNTLWQQALDKLLPLMQLDKGAELDDHLRYTDMLCLEPNANHYIITLKADINSDDESSKKLMEGVRDAEELVWKNKEIQQSETVPLMTASPSGNGSTEVSFSLCDLSKREANSFISYINEHAPSPSVHYTDGTEESLNNARPTNKISDPALASAEDITMSEIDKLAARYKDAAGLDGSFNAGQQRGVLDSGEQAIKKKRGIPKKPYELYQKIQQGTITEYNPDNLLRAFETMLKPMEKARQKMTPDWKPDATNQVQQR